MIAYAPAWDAVIAAVVIVVLVVGVLAVLARRGRHVHIEIDVGNESEPEQGDSS